MSSTTVRIYRKTKIGLGSKATIQYKECFEK